MYISLNLYFYHSRNLNKTICSWSIDQSIAQITENIYSKDGLICKIMAKHNHYYKYLGLSLMPFG